MHKDRTRLAKLASSFCIAVTLNLVTSHATLPSQSNVIFGANLTTNNACFIIVRNGGTMVQNPQGTQMSSQFAGGSPGIADVFAIFPYEISVDTPPFFTARPPGGDNNVAYSTWFSGQALNSRGSNFPSQPGDQAVRLSNFFSYTRLSIDLEASRPDPFPAGSYSTYTTVRCE